MGVLRVEFDNENSFYISTSDLDVLIDIGVWK